MISEDGGIDFLVPLPSRPRTNMWTVHLLDDYDHFQMLSSISDLTFKIVVQETFEKPIEIRSGKHQCSYEDFVSIMQV